MSRESLRMMCCPLSTICTGSDCGQKNVHECSGYTFLCNKPEMTKMFSMYNIDMKCTPVENKLPDGLLQKIKDQLRVLREKSGETRQVKLVEKWEIAPKPRMDTIVICAGWPHGKTQQKKCDRGCVFYHGPLTLSEVETRTGVRWGKRWSCPARKIPKVTMVATKSQIDFLDNSELNDDEYMKRIGIVR